MLVDRRRRKCFEQLENLSKVSSDPSRRKTGSTRIPHATALLNRERGTGRKGKRRGGMGKDSEGKIREMGVENLCTKFGDSHFNRSRDMIVDPKIN